MTTGAPSAPESPRRTSRWRAWVRAARPLAHANIAPPLLLGQALAWALHGRFAFGWLAVAQLFGALDQLFILFVNDASDLEADRQNPHPTAFSGGSRVLVEGMLSRSQLTRAAAWVLALLALLCILLARHGRPLAGALTAAGVGLVWAYSLPPLRLAYRGHGELLQALGVGAVLPLFGYYVQVGSLAGFPKGVLAAAVLLAYAGNVATSLPDEPADRASAKRSYAVRMGLGRARDHAVALTALAGAGLALGTPALSPTARLAVAASIAAPLALAWRLRRSAVPGERTAMHRFLLALGASFTACWLAPAVALIG